MILLGWMATALALGELASDGLSGAPTSRGRALRGILAAALVLACGAFVFTLTAGEWIQAAILELGIVAPWLLLRVQSGTSGTYRERRRSIGALAMLGLGALGAFSWLGTWDVVPRPWILAWLESLPLASLRTADLHRCVWTTGAFLMLLATGNGLVRATLQVAGTPPPRGEGRFKGGRYIGAIERVLIFGLAVAGEPTAAALVVSAKSLLRFPELSKSAQESGTSPRAEGSSLLEVDALTEYFLLGSLSSWALALLAALLVKA